jgi:hypothetical protein
MESFRIKFTSFASKTDNFLCMKSRKSSYKMHFSCTQKHKCVHRRLNFSFWIIPTLGEFCLTVSNPSGGLETIIGTPGERLLTPFGSPGLKVIRD